VYESQTPVFSGFHRVGLTDQLTAGVNLQAGSDQQLFGAHAVWATRYGILQPDVAGSQVHGVGWGYAVRLGYRYTDPANDGAGTLALGAQYRGDHFASFGILDPNNAVAWDFYVRYSHPLPWRMSAGVGGTYQISRDRLQDARGVNLTWGKQIGRGASLNLTLDHRELSTGQTENRAFLSLMFTFPQQRQSARFSYDSFTDTAQANWQYTSADSVGGVDASLGVQRQPNDYNVAGGARYTGYRAVASLFHDVTTPASNAENLDSRTSLGFGTALVYADGQFAVSRPVQDSFAMVVPRLELAGQKIGVDRVRDSYTARADWLGPAVLPSLSSYQVRTLTIDAPDLPLGYELGPSEYTVWPTYRSGTVIRIGTGATVLLSGVLQEADGAPVSLLAAEIVSLSEPTMKPLEVFTNRKGKSVVEGLMPGNFELRLFEEGQPPVSFEIPKGKAGLSDIGSLRLPAAVRPENNLNPDQ
jgi:outer membrane usher protein